MSEAPDPTEMLALHLVFRQEAVELLENLESCLLDLETSLDNMELVDSTFRHLHTLKGIASMYGFERVAGIAHGLESMFERARRKTAPVTGDLIGFALEAHDCMRLLVTGEEHAESGSAVRSRADELIALTGMSLTESDRLEPKIADPGGLKEHSTYRIVLRPGKDALFRGLRPASILDELRTLGVCKVSSRTGNVPSLDDFDPGSLYLEWDVEIFTEEPLSRIEEAFMFLGKDEFSIAETVKKHQRAADAERRSGKDRRKGDRRADRRESETTVRVASGHLDQLVDMVGELVTAHDTLTSMLSSSEDPRLREVTESIGRISEGLRESVLGIRMVPIGSMFGRFRRHVRDLADNLDKEVDIAVEGGDTKLDKGVLDRIAEPLLHILRNSIDHGIESPEVRLASGKSKRGVVTLSALHSAGYVVISISDDGRGVDLPSLARNENYGTVAEGTTETGIAELTEMLFQPGFSTSESVTSVSGRGVGLDVVKRTLEELRGAVVFKTNPGKGTTVLLKVPLTLAIVEGLVAHVGEECYIFPLAAVESCIEVEQSPSWRDHGRDLIDVQGALLPLIRLRQYFEVPCIQPSSEVAVIVSADGERFGVVVDEVRDSVQVVIKPLSRFLRGAKGLSGMTVLGDGRVVSVLDLGGLLKAVSSDLGFGEAG